MHPVLERRRRLAIYLIAWALLGLALGGALGLSGVAWPAALALAVPLAVVYGFVCLAAWYPCRAAPLGRTPPARLVAAHGGAAIFSAGLWLVLLAVELQVLRALAFADLPELPAVAPLFFAVGVVLYLLAVAVHYLLASFEEARAAERRELDLRVAAREAELRALRAQIDPHFLFNCLNSISALAGSDAAAARRMCQLLADFLRQSLRLGALESVPLADELALAANALAVERVRFGDRLRVAEQVDEAARGCLVPPLLLQPLVENAVTHGIAQLVEGGTILLRARVEGDRLSLELENPADPDRAAARGAGLGLANVRARLRVLYGAEAGLETREADGVFRVRLWLPARSASGSAPGVPGAAA